MMLTKLFLFFQTMKVQLLLLIFGFVAVISAEQVSSGGNCVKKIDAHSII